MNGLDARAQLLLLVAYLVALSSVPPGANGPLVGLCLVPLAVIAIARLAWEPLLTQAAYILPFSLTVALFTALLGDYTKAFFFLTRSFFSVLGVLVATTLATPADLLRAMEGLGFPRFLILVTEFLMRYLQVLKDEVQHMRVAALSRGGSQSRLIAAGTIGMLFVRSLERSTRIHECMVARGFQGRLPRLRPLAWQGRDTVALLSGMALLALLRFAL